MWASVRGVVRGEPPRLDLGPYLRQGIQGREERLHLLQGVGQEKGLPAPRFLYLLPLNYLEMLAYVLDLALQSRYTPVPELGWASMRIATATAAVLTPAM